MNNKIDGQLRTYIVYYYREENDECVDLEIEVRAICIKTAVVAFNKMVRFYKRIYAVNEKSHNSSIK
jgi:hypothetical protein